MAFDRPVEADRVDDLGLFSSLVRAGVAWLLGGDNGDKADEESSQIDVVSNLIDRDIMGDSTSVDGNIGRIGCVVNGSTEFSMASQSQSDSKGDNKENKEPLSLRSESHLDHSLINHTRQRAGSGSTIQAKHSMPCSSGQSEPATHIIGDLVTAMDTCHVSYPGPATSAVLSSENSLERTNSLSASYSASPFTFDNNNIHITRTSTQKNNSGSGSKKMSWSDECGNGSLVEYFDADFPSRPKHWSAMRRSRHIFDGGDNVKSALKRSGSYSPPVSLHASTSTDTSSASSSVPQLKSYRSISVIGSSDGSASDSLDTDDSVTAVTVKKLHSKDIQCVPSSLQVGCARASGGLIIPRGGPADQGHYFPRRGHDTRYQVILGAGAPGAYEQQSEPSDMPDRCQNAEDEAHTKAASNFNPSHFLPRTNGYVSPQYGFYVNITPPTPELHATRNPGDSKMRSFIQQQSYQQFQYQNQYKAPSPIPEGVPDGSLDIPHRFAGESYVMRTYSSKPARERDQLRQISLKSKFTKNKKRMGTYSSPEEGAAAASVWPSVPFG